MSGEWKKAGTSPLAATEIFCLANMIGHIRSVLHPDWLPSNAKVSVAAPSVLSSLPPSEGLRITKSNRSTTVIIPLEQLWLPVARTSASADTRPFCEAYQPTTTLDFVQSLRLIMMSYARTGRLNIENAAEAAGLSSRTLQRRLRDAGLTYSQLVDQVRYEVARRLLVGAPDLSVTQIGLELGYNDPGSFSRAFRRFTGLPPAEYRRQTLQGPDRSAA